MRLCLTALVLSLTPPSTSAFQGATESPLHYVVDLRQPGDDLFHVTLEAPELTSEDRYLDFVAYAPGVHSPLHFGRFVREISALDAAGDEIELERIDTNRWEIAAPERVALITYDIEDSFDADITQDRVIPCGGTGINESYVLLNNYGVLGYFANHLQRPIELQVLHPPGWTVGTALSLDEDGIYRSPSYRELADSPILMGPADALTTTSLLVGDIEVEIFVHSSSPELNADEILYVAGDALLAAERFIGFAPVDRYAFLMIFIDQETLRNNNFRSLGALEHSYSSVYTLPAFGGALDQISSVISHEFMHILTPLHLKSTIIAEFDYSIPTTDRHLWLYEGLTEWSAGMLRLRGGVIDMDRHLQLLSQKIRATRQYDQDYSLTRLSAEWATPDGGRQYGNIYQLGALSAALLDIRILELSGGERGLREVFFALLHRYGKDRPFRDASFFDDLVAETYPEVGEFVRDHIQDNVPLPYAEYFGKIGIDFDSSMGLRLAPNCTPQQELLRFAWSRSLLED